MRLPQLLTRALFLEKTMSGSRLYCGGQFTVIVAVPLADLPVASVAVKVAVMVLDCDWPPLSKFKLEPSKVALALLSFVTLPSLTVHL